MSEDINKLKTDFAVMNNKLDNIEQKLDKTISMIETHTVDEENRYADIMNTKADRAELEKVKDNIAWVVKVVMGLVITALISLVILK